MGKFVDLSGRVIGRLTVVECLGKQGGVDYLYKCLCSCGNTSVKKGSNLRSGTKSCGCLHTENAKIALELTRDVHKTHGMTKTKTYVCWKNMKSRCDDVNQPAYQNYGKRGISYIERWSQFENFLEDMGECSEGLTLNRIDVNGDYCKENCEWVTMAEQGRDKRKPVSGKTSPYKGVTWSSAESKYKGTIMDKGVSYHLGYSHDPLYLALKYDEKLLSLTGSNSGGNLQLGLLPDRFYKDSENFTNIA